MARPQQQVPPAIVLVDKAQGMTSHDVVSLCRRVFNTRKIGHAGTLDPMATGLLTLGVGSATRLTTHLVGLDKVYTATIRLGQATLSDDRESEVLTTAPADKIVELADDTARIMSEAKNLAGIIQQVPSAVSAIKLDGKRAYDLVRDGEMPELKAREVTIYGFELENPRIVKLEESVTVLDIDARVHCSSGTYIRALARDLGAALGVGAHLTALRRESVGDFQVAEANSTELLETAAPPRRPRPVKCGTGPAQMPVETEEDIAKRNIARQEIKILTPAKAAARVIPVLQITADEERDIRHGKQIAVADGAGYKQKNKNLLAAVNEDGVLVAILSAHKGKARVETGFPGDDPAPVTSLFLVQVGDAR